MSKSTMPGVITCLFLCGPAAVLAGDDCPKGTDCDLVYSCHPGLHGVLEGGPRLVPSVAPSPIAGGVEGVETILLNGDPSNRVDLVFVGDGYLEPELSAYAPRCVAALEALFDEEPFTSYRPFFNAHRVDVVSAESGVDNDPVEGIDRNTALGMAFWCGGTERLLCVSVAAAEQAAAAAPDVDQIFAVANSTKYGGAGYSGNDIGTFSSDNSASLQVAIHELGHSLGNLADEYHYGGGSTWTGPEPSTANISTLEVDEMADSSAKWFRWLGFVQPGLGAHDTFEGAGYHEFGLFRPTANSMMRELNQRFNMPGREALIIEFSKVVDLIEDRIPADSIVPADATASVVTVEPLHGLDYRWEHDGIEIPNATTSMLDLATIATLEDGDLISVIVTDSTDMVRDEAARADWMTDRMDWIVSAPSAPDPDLNGDGRVDGADLGIMLLYWGSSGTPGDLDGDGQVGGPDLGIMLAGWTG